MYLAGSKCFISLLVVMNKSTTNNILEVLAIIDLTTCLVACIPTNMKQMEKYTKLQNKQAGTMWENMCFDMFVILKPHVFGMDIPSRL